jgi:hypothetical protein
MKPRKKIIQDWFELDGDPGFQQLTEEQTAAVIFFIFISTTYISSVGIATGYGLDDQGEREFESR